MHASRLLLTFLPCALATVYITEPIESSVWTGGVPVSMTWQDDSVAPLLADLGNLFVGLYYGSYDTFIPIRHLGNVAATALTGPVTVPANAGPNGNSYFLIVRSLSAAYSSSDYFVYSPQFTLTGMTGTFSADQLATLALTSTEAVVSTVDPATSVALLPTTTTTVPLVIPTTTTITTAAALTTARVAAPIVNTITSSGSTGSSASQAETTTSYQNVFVFHADSAASSLEKSGKAVAVLLGLIAFFIL